MSLLHLSVSTGDRTRRMAAMLACHKSEFDVDISFFTFTIH